jgi:hypothetical protein
MDEVESDTFVSYNFEVTMCRLVGKLLLPSKLNLKLGIEFLTDDEDEIEFSLTKVKHWLDKYVARCVAVSCMNVDGFGMLLNEENTPRLENTMMITAVEPTDHHLMFIFQSKINALADGAFEVFTVDITSDDAQGLTFTYVGDGEGQLPDMDEWIAGSNWFTVPWWHRNDISMIDTVAPEGTDLTVRPTWASTLDFLRPDTSEQTAIVLKADWEPRIIEGDKKK